MKRVFLVLLVSAIVVAGFLIAAVYLEKDRFSDTAAVFVERLWIDVMDPEVYKLTNTDEFLDFHAPETLQGEVQRWRGLLGAYRGIGAKRGATELAPGRTQVAVQLLFENGSAEARVVFQERKGAHGIERFALDLEPDTELPPDAEAALPTAFRVGDALRTGNAPGTWKTMSYGLRNKVGSSRAWHESVAKRFGDLTEPGDPEEIVPFGFDKDDPSLFKGTWQTPYENGTLRVRMTLRWVDVAWRLDDLELKRLD